MVCLLVSNSIISAVVLEMTDSYMAPQKLGFLIFTCQQLLRLPGNETH